MATIWFDGIEELYVVAAELRTKRDRIGEQGEAVVKAAAHRVEAAAKLFVPVDTGHLKSTIGPPRFIGAAAGAGMEAAISATARYAVYVEYGTRYIRPRPYMGAALEAVAPQFLAAAAAISDPFDGGRLVGVRGGG